MKKRKVLFGAMIICLLSIPGFIVSSVVHADEAINIATAGIGGSYYPIGAAIADVLSKHAEGITGSAEVSGASIENVKLVGRKKVRLAFAEAAFGAAPGYLGLKPFDKKYDIRCVSALHYSAGTYVVLKRFGIKKFTEYERKKGCRRQDG